jgi:hypothetical protein
MYRIIIKALLTFSASFAIAGPNLVVHPTRLLFEKNSRSAQIDITNTGDQSATYRISIENKRMDEMGKFVPATKAIEGEHFASDMIQYSPRQVELAPGAGQTVRISLRKPANLEAGEYRSHIAFQRLPDANSTSVESAAKLSKNEIGIVLTPLVGVSIPLIVREGETSATIALKDLKFQPASKNEPATLAMKLERAGNRSIYGDLDVKLVKKDGGEEKVGTVSGIAVYPPNQTRQMKVVLRPEEGSDFSAQKLKILFKEQEQGGGSLQAEADLKLP